MASSGNFCTFNPLNQKAGASITYVGGNTKSEHANNLSATRHGATFNIPLSGKWYFELKFENNNTGGGLVSLFSLYDVNSESIGTNNFTSTAGTFITYYAYQNRIYISNSYTAYTSNIGTQAGAIVSVAIDRDNNHMWVALNNTWINGTPNFSDGTNKVASPTAGLDYGLAFSGDGGAYNNAGWTCNFGQASDFLGTETAQGNSDANGFGDFYYAPPSGYLGLCSANLPISDDIDPAGDDGADDNPTKHFNTVIFDGNGSSNAVTGLGFKPDLIWGFTRDGGQSKRMIDSTRGGSSRMYSDLDSAEDTSTATISEFGTDGFTATGGAFNNDNNKDCGAWCWKANGGTTSSNSSGTITSTVQANTKGGFSIITYTGSGSNATIGHGLSSAPDFFLVKDRARAGEYWGVYHSSLGATKYLTLNTNAAAATNSNRWNDTEPTDSLIGLGTNDNTNGSSTYLCYAWHSVKGSSKFGTYTGNGNADGPFIYTGFRPRMLFFKRTSAGHNWITFDTATVTSNANDEYANWDLGTASSQGASDKIDFLSNGFKLRSTGSSFNGSGAEFVYGAWGDVPFKYNNTF